MNSVLGLIIAFVVVLFGFIFAVFSKIYWIKDEKIRLRNGVVLNSEELKMRRLSNRRTWSAIIITPLILVLLGYIIVRHFLG